MHAKTSVCLAWAGWLLASAHAGPPPFLERRLSDLPGATDREWTVAALTEAALYFHSDMALARSQAALAEAAVVTAGARPNPSLSLAPQFLTPLKNYERGTYTAGLDIPIETGGKRARRIEQATWSAGAAQLLTGAAAWQVRGRVRQATMAWAAAEQRFELTKASVKHQVATAETLQRRMAAGESARTELLQTRLLYNQTELALADARKLMAEARVALANAVGVPGAALQRIEVAAPPLERLPAAATLRVRAREGAMQRSDVRAAEAERAASELAVRTELVKRFPDLHLLPGYSYDDKQNKVELGLSFELPILQQNQGPIAEARARLAQARARAEAAVAKASGEIELALASYTGALGKVERAEALLAEQQKSLAISQRLFEAGETDRTVIATAEVERDTIAVQRLEALFEAQKSLGAFEQAAEWAADGWRPRLEHTLPNRR